MSENVEKFKTELYNKFFIELKKKKIQTKKHFIIVSFIYMIFMNQMKNEIVQDVYGMSK